MEYATNGLDTTFSQWTSGLETVGTERDENLDKLFNMAAGEGTSTTTDNGDPVQNNQNNQASLTEFQVASLKYSQAQAKVSVVDETAKSGIKIVKDGAGAINR